MLGDTYPNFSNLAKPSPEPALPAGIDPFSPPVSTNLPSPGSPVVAEWTHIAKPDAVLSLTGSAFSSFTGTSEGKDTQFAVFGQNVTTTFSGFASILRQDGQKAGLILPAALPPDSEYLLWPINSVGAGAPVSVNATETWWLGPNAAPRGGTVSVYGRNLIHNATTNASYVYLQKSGSAGTWASVTAANPYKVDFTVPAGLANGDYQVWVHNGRGGHYGWSGPLTLTINNGTPWSGQKFNVKTFGAKGDGVTDDESAIEAAVEAASHNPWSTVYLPAGTYLVNRGFSLGSQTRWQGDGPTQTFLKAGPGFVKPPAYDGRRYCLLFTPGPVHDLTVQDLTVDANSNLNGYLNVPVYMRFDTDLHLTNVTIKAKGYSIADFHGSNRVSLQNCDLIGGGSGIFFGSAHQVRIDGSRFFGTNDANTLITFWGGDGLSCTNTTGQDFNNTQSDGWAQGRFIYGSSGWGSNRHIYIGDCTTRNLAVRPASPEQNTGEQILWEDGTKYSGTPITATPTTVTFPDAPFFKDAGLHLGQWEAVIVNGTGLGQHRKIVSCLGDTITVTPPWNVAPDSSSTLIFAGAVSQCALYHNSLQGKSDYLTHETASAGIQPYGNSFDFIADSNTIKQTRIGIYMWGMSETNLKPASICSVYFNYIANNSVSHCVNGIIGVSHAWNGWKQGDPYPGITYLANTYVNNTVDSVTDSALALWANGAPIGDQADMIAYDHNTVTNAPTGIDLDADGRSLNSLIYKNSLTLGSASTSNAVALALGGTQAPALRQNLYQGFVTAYGGNPAPADMAAPLHVISLQGATRGSAVRTSVTLWNVGTLPSSCSLSSDSPWLSTTASIGPLPRETGSSSFTITCDPSALSPGNYTGTITAKISGQSHLYTVTFKVTGTAVKTNSRRKG